MLHAHTRAIEQYILPTLNIIVTVILFFSQAGYKTC